MKKPVRFAALAIALSLAAAGAHAQDKYPSKPIRLITPFAPGFAFARATRSFTDLAGTAGLTIIRYGWVVSCTMGTKVLRTS